MDKRCSCKMEKITDTTHSDNLVCDKCGGNEWERPEWGGRLLIDPPLFVYFCKNEKCKKKQHFTFIHDQDGRKWHELSEEQIVCIASPSLDEIRKDSEKWFQLRKKLGLCTDIQIMRRMCDCCKKVVDEAYFAKTIMDGKQFICVVHDESTEMKFHVVRDTENPNSYIVADVCNVGRYCFRYAEKSKFIMLIAEPEYYDFNDLYVSNNNVFNKE